MKQDDAQQADQPSARAISRSPTVPYVSGRRRALARALAIEASRLQDAVWTDLRASERRRLEREADEVIRRWISNGVLVEFLYEYREVER